MFRLEHPPNVTPGRQAHRGKYFQLQRLRRSEGHNHEAASPQHPKGTNLLSAVG